MKYFYTCPIKALYMMKEFHVKIEDCKFRWDMNTTALLTYTDNDEKVTQELVKAILDFSRVIFRPGDIKIYVAPESESIFEPKENDIVLGLVHDRAEGEFEDIGEYRDFDFKDIRQIIMRNNKQFFIPESSN